MEEFDLIVRGADVFTAGNVIRCDIGIRNGRIASLGANLGTATEYFEAEDRLVLPGGIDTHVHLEQPVDAPIVNADTFATGTASAAAGGTTTVICFVRQVKGQSLRKAYDDYVLKAQNSRIDYGFHLIVSDPRPEVLDQELPALVAAGNRSIKIFMTYAAAGIPDSDIIRVLSKARELGALACVHTEHHDLITYMQKQLVESGHTAPKYHAWSKPILVEREGCQRIIAMAEALDVPIKIFHVTGAEPAAVIAGAQKRGLKVWAETCPQYLMFTADNLDLPGFEGAKFICSPALRTKSDQEAIWQALRDGTITNVSSDHAATRYEGPDGKQAFGTDAPFTIVPNGLAGVAARLPILFSEGVSKGRIDLAKFVELTSTNPAKIFGMHPQKGEIAIGADADLTIWDPHKTVTLTNERMHHGCDYTAYENVKVTGYPVTTIVRGKVVFNDDEVVGETGWGRFVARGPYDLIRPRGISPVPFDFIEQRTTEHMGEQT